MKKMIFGALSLSALSACIDTFGVEEHNASRTDLETAEETILAMMENPAGVRRMEAFSDGGSRVIVCGLVNGQYSEGGYFGWIPFYVHLRNGTPTSAFVNPFYGSLGYDAVAYCDQARRGIGWEPSGGSFES